jgi:ABC-type Zn2+ transport system substrate-binding protein/surface adhesin
MNEINSTENESSNPEPILPVLDDIDFETYADNELVELAAELKTKVSYLEMENMIFDSFLIRMLPIINLEEGSEVSKTVDDSKDGDKATTRRDKKKKIGDKKEADRPYYLNYEQKNEIAVRETEELRDAFAKEKEEWAKVFDNFRAEVEELDIRLAETKKSSYEFKRDIITQAINPRTDKIISEKMVRYYEDKAKDKVLNS